MEKGIYILWLCKGKLKRVRKASCPDFFFPIHISTLRRFNRANKKKSFIYTLKQSHLPNCLL